MSEKEKQNQQQDLNLEFYDDEDDLWEMQSTEKNKPKQIDFEDEKAKLKPEPKSLNKDDILDEEKRELRIGNQENIDKTTTKINEKIIDSQAEKTELIKDENQPLTTELETDESELMMSEIHSWLDDEDENETVKPIIEKEEKSVNNQVQSQNISDDQKSLNTEIQQLEKRKKDLIKQQEEITNNLSLLVKQGLNELEQKKQNLEITIQKLEQRKERIEQEMRTTFAGVSQDLAIRVQGFKDYLVGSLQDLAAATEQLELPSATLQTWESNPSPVEETQPTNLKPQFATQSFQQETRQIRSLLDQYRSRPDYYGSPWQLRRTFEPIHAERVSNWFFSLGGRGAIPSMGSRLQNILVASAVMSILFQLYGDRSCTLILSDTPERLGEWRRGLQDCLGISRSDFGPNRGVTLFEAPEPLTQRAERLVESGDLPLIIIDQSNDQVSLSLLQFPLWLAFASDKPVQSANYFY